MKHLKLLALLLSITFLAACGGGGDESAISAASADKNTTASLVEPQSGWWWNPAESGRGFSIERQGNQIFMASYLYETNGVATWYTSALTRQSSGAYSGAMQRYSGGQTLLGTYKAPAATTSVVANALLSFNTATTGSLTITFADGSPDHTITLERFPFSPPNAIAPSNASFENGWWWNEAESGRGYFIEVQGSQAFIASYMFDNTGQPTWYVSAAALQGSQGLSGLLDQYTNGQSLGGSFKAPTKVASSGTMTFNFSNSTTANMVLPNGSSVALKRFIFSTLPTTNIAPVANAGFAQNVVVGSVVTLDGSASTDVNSDPLSYAWTLTSKPAGSAAMLPSSTSVKPTFTADVVGTYVASLVVNDGKVNSTNAATVSSTAAVANVAPVANAGVAQNVVAGTLVTLDGSASSDANGDPLTYAWTLTAKPAGSAATLSSSTSVKPTFTADVVGTYVASLIVNDGKVNSSAASVSITATLANVVGPGQFMEAVLLKTIATSEITSAIELAGDSAFRAIPRYAVQAYRLTYLTLDGQAQEILASALVVLPQKPGGSLSPVLSYQHGTIKHQVEAPSNLADIGTPEVILASLGYIVLSADYVGYGVSKAASHPYLLSGPSAAAVIDLLTAAKYWRQTQQVRDNRQLFLVGYSEGGYVTMAAHRTLQAGTSTQRGEIVSVVPGAGPYNVGLTLDEDLKLVRQANPLLGALLYPGFLKYLSDADRHNVRDQLLQQMLGSDTDVNFMPTFIDNYMADDRASIESLSNVYDWRPEAPVNLFHGRDDLTVSYKNATSTLQAMQARGAGNLVSLTDCTAQPAGHSECVLPYWQFMLDTLAKVAKDL